MRNPFCKFYRIKDELWALSALTWCIQWRQKFYPNFSSQNLTQKQCVLSLKSACDPFTKLHQSNTLIWTLPRWPTLFKGSFAEFCSNFNAVPCFQGQAGSYQADQVQGRRPLLPLLHQRRRRSPTCCCSWAVSWAFLEAAFSGLLTKHNLSSTVLVWTLIIKNCIIAAPVQSKKT